ncbi:MAG: NAD-dependent epimerase/dehydratase family protein [Bacteroidota bacterium]
MILITGATGFLGSEVAKQLAEAGTPVRCIKRASSVIPALLLPYSSLITWVDADILNYPALDDAFDGITQVYHCAAWVSLKSADKEPMIRTNVEGTANVVNLCMLYGARLLHVSSVAAIGEAKPGEMITENHHLDESAANDGYATSKLESEMEVWRGVAEGLDAIIVNPSIIIGPNTGILGSGALFETVRKGLKFYTSGSIGFVDVEDVAKCMIMLMSSDIHEERFIISAENRGYQNITTEIAQCFNLTPPNTLAKPWMMELAWRGAAFWAALRGGAPAIDKVSAQSASVERNYDNSKLKKAIAFNFKPVSQSVAEVCARLKV